MYEFWRKKKVSASVGENCVEVEGGGGQNLLTTKSNFRGKYRKNRIVGGSYSSDRGGGKDGDSWWRRW